MATFTDEDKVESTSNYFGQGVHKVKISTVIFGETESGKEFAEFNVLDDEGREGNARLWFSSDGARKYSFNIIRTIFVHNAAEDKKDAVRDQISNIANTEELEKACQKLSGKECWYTVYESPDRTYTDQSGKVRKSFDKNVYGYEPAPKEVSETKEEKSDEADIDLGVIPF